MSRRRRPEVARPGGGRGAPGLGQREPERFELRAAISSFRYHEQGTPVLADVSLSFRQGEVVVIAGPSGSGKSTLALALAGLVPGRVGGLLEGEVRLERATGAAIDLTSVPLHEAAQHVGITFQNPEYQLIQYQVAAEVAFGPENLGLPHEEVVARVHGALAAVRADDLAQEAISSLSGGQKQRVAIAAALAMAPPLLVLDEPTSDLDPVGTQQVMEILHELSHTQGHGVVLVEHKLDEVVRYADRVILLAGGRVVLDEHPRRAFLPTARWHAAGVRPPELITLAELLPEAFTAGAPLTVDEAATALDQARLVAAASSGAAAQAAALAPDTREAPAAPPAFHAHGLRVSYKGKVALADVSLKVAAGEWVALIGANGSGKTTLGATLMGFLTPDAGSASCFGEPVSFGRIAKQADRVGYLFQNVDDMLFGASVAAELEFTARHRVPAGRDAPAAAEVAALIGLADRGAAHPYNLSGGERQRLALGALLTRAPRALILDEPTTGLDELHAEALFDLLARVRTALGSLTCLLITHDMRLVARFADRVIALRAGEIVLDTTPRRAFSQAQLLASCGVRPPEIAALHSRLDPDAREVAVSAHELSSLLGPNRERTMHAALR
jgi:energy-coupling factor transport system ATP-binding protein